MCANQLSLWSFTGFELFFVFFFFFNHCLNWRFDPELGNHLCQLSRDPFFILFYFAARKKPNANETVQGLNTEQFALLCTPERLFFESQKQSRSHQKLKYMFKRRKSILEKEWVNGNQALVVQRLGCTIQWISPTKTYIELSSESWFIIEIFDNKNIGWHQRVRAPRIVWKP